MKVILKALLIIGGILLLGFLSIYPPTAVIVYTLLTILGIYWGWIESKNSCSRDDK